ncbi:23S rRNA (guanosine(2251)-2'-O)-methyltransferase RlmB [Clostridium sp. C8-1-8]|uniref:23S rRNA (guanosine(2251)-2'-O)-methyltransferase RlmB n=1 Tax=Clostridium sp. C8-1-8 TaxID=2698831 RepID=UPI001FAB6DFC|nr:23S rRNA (guanosine(2251)-2'-O)-methyltransferase RlmB [Clostridium sp. C8-1-8]
MAQRMNRSNNRNEFKSDYKKGIKNDKVESNKKNVREERREADAPIREDIVEGRNAVIEALKSDRTIEQILIASGNMEGSINKVIAIAREKKIVIKEVDRKKLDSISETGAHQGVIAIVTPFKYSEVEDILRYAEEKSEKPFIVILDELEDPHNLGSIVRTAELSGVHGIIIPKRRNVGVTATVYKAAAGAIEHMKIAKVTNINTVIDELKELGIWVYGAEIDGDSYSYETDFSGPCALIIGSEGRGMSKLTKDKCDKLVKIPMVGKINSLNASVAGGIMMYEILKSRLSK